MNKRLNAADRKAAKRAENQRKGMMYRQTEARVDEVQPATILREGTLQDSAEKANLQRKMLQGEVNAKTLAKAMGFKSALVFEGKLAVTSFADSKNVGDEQYKSANIEKLTGLSGEEIVESRFAAPKMFQTDVKRENIQLSHGKESTVVPNPAGNMVGRDYIGIKKQVEEEFFGEIFSDDNIHVQIAYNILDIKKILGTYINNIIYMFYNLNRGKNGLDEKTYDDLIGTLYSFKPLEKQREYVNRPGKETDAFRIEQVEKLLEKTSAYYTYFSGLFKEIPCWKDQSKSEQRNKAISYNYDVLRLLSFARQLCVHSLTGQKTDRILSEAALFDLEQSLSAQNQDLLNLLDEVYSNGVKILNEGFQKNSGKNLFVLHKLYPEETEAKLTEKYYRLTILKDDLNMGVNIKKLREMMVSKNFPEILDKEYDLSRDENSVLTYRSKIYTVMNYILLYAIEQNDALRLEMVDALRKNRAGEEGKEKIYAAYADKIWTLVGDQYKKCLDLFKEEKKGKFENKLTIGKTLGGYALSAQNTDYFAKLLYFVCKFLDGKEINELLCSMINKFDNIADLMDATQRCGCLVKFKAEYSFFEKSRTISLQLRCVKNIAAKGFKKSNKEKTGETYGKNLYLDALALFGENVQKFKVDANREVLRDAKGNPVETERYRSFVYEFFEEEKRDEYGKIVYDRKTGKPKKEHKKRNFLLNNVLKSKWFFYVVKYLNPLDCRQLIKNKNIVRMVLRDIPDAQIRRYYKAVMGKDADDSADKMKAVLVNELSGFSIGGVLDEVRAMTDKEFASQKATDDKERKKALIRLYLTVCYLLAKSMVKVNTRFSIAFSVLERDIYLHFGKDMANGKGGGEWLRLTRQYVGRDKDIYENWREANKAAQEQYADKAKRKEQLRKNDKLLREMHFTPHSLRYIASNLQEAEELSVENVIKVYRDAVIHVNVVNRMEEYLDDFADESITYYGLYCYCLQRYLCECDEGHKLSKLKGLQARLNEYRTYNKDFMWLLNLPFAYNLARYKNLSSEKLFYDEPEQVPERSEKTADKDQ